MVGEITVLAPSEEEAITEVLNRLGVGREAIGYEVRAESDDALLPGAKPEIEVRAWIKAEWISEQAEKRLRGLLEHMKIEYEIEAACENRIIQLNVIAGEASSILIGRDGQNLAAIQYLVNRMVLRSGREAPMVVVDVEGYRRRQFSVLETLVERAVERARQTGNEIELDPMPPATRKYLHNYLRRFEDIKTFSRGEEPERYLVIIAD
jgi:spoIIIJ-associated protein